MAVHFALEKVNKEGFILRDFQERVINAYSKGKDCFCISPTGSGKSLTFILAPFVFDYVTNKEDSLVLIVQPLVALMKDQVTKLHQLNIPAVYIGEDSEETVDRDYITKKNIKFIIGAPESILKKNRLKLLKSLEEQLCVIFIDESHCVRTMGYSKKKEHSNAFRKVYSDLGRLRSLLPATPLVTLTATATIEIRETILSDFCMTDCEYVIMDCDKKNIRYTVIEVVNDIEVNFGWLIELLKAKGIQTERVIIFCRSRKQCTELYSLFKDKLGELSYHLTNDQTLRDDRSCLFAMYHLTTLAEQKSTVENSFRDSEGITRVLFCTSSFGMGIDVKGCNLCIHYGPPGTTDEYLQQSGRIGRDCSPSHAVILKYKTCFSGAKFDKEMKEFCEAKVCRRKILMNSINNESSEMEIKHSCCDVCSLICKCLCDCSAIQCTCQTSCHLSITASFAENSIIHANQISSSEKKKLPVYHVTEAERNLFEIQLLEYRDSLLNDSERKQLLVHSDLVTGFSLSLVSELVKDMEFLGDLSYVLHNFPFFNEKHADKVLDILKGINPDLTNRDHVLSSDNESIESITASGEEFSDEFSDVEETRPCVIFSDSESD